MLTRPSMVRTRLIALRAFVLVSSTMFMVADATALLRGTTGILEGRIIDKQSRGGIVGVNVLLRGTILGGSSDAQGYYRIPNIKAGVYDVRFSIIGYKTVMMKNVTILPDLRTRLDMELEVATIELAPIEIRAERPLIQRDLAGTAFSIGEMKLEKLPVSSFQEVLTLQPGTTLEGNVRGGKSNEVLFFVDGLPVQDFISGGLATNLPRSSITALTIHTGGFEAEYGNALSGVVNVITKSGGDSHKFGGRYEKDGWLPENWNEQQDRATDLELFASGPLEGKALSYFVANTFTTSDTRWWQDFRHFFMSPVRSEFTGFGKVDYLPTATFRLSGQLLYSIRRWHDYEFSWRFNLTGLPERMTDAYRLAVILSHTLSESSFYTVSLSRFYQRSRIGDEDENLSSLQAYEYDFFLRYIVAGRRNWWADTRQIIYSLKGDVTTQLGGTHLLKVGGELNQYDIVSELQKFEPRKTYFGKPMVDAQLLNYSNSYSYRPRSGGIFVQDKVEVVRDGSNVSFGLRWDFLDPTAERPIVEYIPVRENEYEQVVTGTSKVKFKHQFSPRIALAMPVGPLSFFFVNFGHYFQFPLFDYLYSGVNPSQLRAGTKSMLAANPDLDPERTIAWEVGFKHGITHYEVGSVTYFRKSFRNQIDSKTLIPFDSKSSGDYGFASYVNNAEALATGLEVVLSRERDERLSGSISYTYMLTEGISEFVEQSIAFAQWGFPVPARPFPLSWDQRHTIKADAEFKLAYDLQADVVALYNSPRPYTYFPTRDGYSPSNPAKVFIPNNARMEPVLFVNMKLSRQFELGESNSYLLTLFADVRNLLNSKNVRWMDSSGRIGGELGDPSAYYDPRRIRLGMKLDF